MARGKKARSMKGTGLAEVSVASLILIVMALFALDIGTAMVCYGLNDRACRDAARAAAQGQSPAEAQNLAQQILRSYASNTSLTESPVLLKVNYKDFDGSPPDGVSPFVSVTTRMQVRTIAPFSAFGKNTIADKFPVTKTYTFPIVKLKVASTGAGG